MGGSASGGGISDTSGSSWEPSLAIDPEGRPMVAWRDSSSGNEEIYLRRFDGVGWVELGTGSATAGGISNSGNQSFAPSLSVIQDRACVSWYEADGATVEQIWLRCTE